MTPHGKMTILPAERVLNLPRIELTMKPSFITLLFTFLSCFAVSCAAFGQTPNVPVLKVEAPDIVAEINGDKITRTSLTAECLQLYGEKELQELIDKTLIRLECERRKITITAEEINTEVRRMAQIFNLTSEQWLQVIEQRRGISPEQYRQDIIWGVLALGKLAGPRLSVNEAELQVAYEAQFGPAVQLRQIVLASKAEAEEVLAELKQHPETFAAIAKNRSIDTVSQPYGGMLLPIRRHSMNPNIENILFALKPGEISPIIEFLPGYFTIYRCEGHLQKLDVDVNTVKEQLTLDIQNTKRKQVSDEVFAELQSRAQVKIMFGNPALNRQYPGVAALLNGQTISIKELGDLCVQKHGTEVLNDMVNRLLVEQACRREGIIISEQDIDNEIREMAFKHLSLLPNGAANIELWLQRATDETGLSIPMYRKNVVVPVLSLKRLTRRQIEVTEDDVRRSFDANFGQKVQCLAIFFNAQDNRRAQEVWQAANRHKTEENFGDLAEKWSFDPDSRLGRGVIPPIARHCGQPTLEREAFALKPGELSQIIQVDDHLVILYCVGYVEPLRVKIEDVRTDLIADIFEKKQQVLISRYFEKLYEQAVLDNYLTGESQNPALERAIREEAAQQR